MKSRTTAPHRGARDRRGPAVAGTRVVTHRTQTIEADPDRVFSLLCPVREAEWLEGWSGTPVYAESGVAEENGVFVASPDDGAEPVVWYVTRRDPATRETEFVAFVPGEQVFRLSLAVTAAGPRRSRVDITYVRTGLSDAGNAALAQAERSGTYDAMLTAWEDAMNHYVTTGRLLTAAGPDFRS